MLTAQRHTNARLDGETDSPPDQGPRPNKINNLHKHLVVTVEALRQSDRLDPSGPNQLPPLIVARSGPLSGATPNPHQREVSSP